MDITSQQVKIVQQILNKHLPPQSAAWIFGSRANKAKKKFSDLDLAIDCKIALSISTISSLEHDFSESDLPYKVDIIDLNNVNESFRDKITSEMVLLWQK